MTEKSPPTQPLTHSSLISSWDRSIPPVSRLTQTICKILHEPWAVGTKNQSNYFHEGTAANLSHLLIHIFKNMAVCRIFPPSIPLLAIFFILSIPASNVKAETEMGSSLFSTEKEKVYKNSFMDDQCLEMANERPSK